MVYRDVNCFSRMFFICCEEITCSADRDSYAEWYCVRNGMDFIHIQTENCFVGISENEN